MKNLKKYKQLFESDNEDTKKPPSYYRKKFDDVRREVEYEVITEIENILSELKLSWFYFDGYNIPQYGKYYIYDLQEGRNGSWTIEYFDKDGEAYVDLDESGVDTIISIYEYIDGTTIQDVISDAVENERPHVIEEILEGDRDDIDLSNFYNGDDILNAEKDYPHSIENMFNKYNIQEHILKNHKDKIIELLVDDSDVEIDNDILNSYDFQDYIINNHKDRIEDILIHDDRVTINDDIYKKYNDEIGHLIDGKELGII